jgi:hypothetical protein
LRAFGTDLQTMSMTKASVKAVERVLRIPKLTKVADSWIYTNQIEGEKKGSVQKLDADHPAIKDVLAPLSDQERSQVEELVDRHQISQQQMQAQILEKQLQIAAAHGSTIVGGPVKNGTLLTSTLLDALRADRSDPNAARIADAQIEMVQKKMEPEQFLPLYKYAQAAVDSWNLQREFFDKNPAWSSGKRTGKFLASYTVGGKSKLAGVDSSKEANQIAKERGWKLVNLESNVKGQPDSFPNLGPDAPELAARLRENEQTKLDILANTGRYTPEQLAEIKQYSGVEQTITEAAYRGGVPGLKPQPRGLTRGAEDLPWLQNHLKWTSQQGTYWSRQLFRAEARAQLMDPTIAANPDMQTKLRQHYDNMLVPDTPTGKFMQRLASNWFMGFNPASAFINASQPFVTHTAEFTAMTGKPVDSYRRVIGALKEILNANMPGGKWTNPDHEWLMAKAKDLGELSFSMYDDLPAADEHVATNFVRVMNGERSQTLGQKLSTMWGNWSHAGMWMFKGVERINNQAALIASFDYYRELEPNLSRDEAMTKAVEFNHAVNYGGGAAQRPITPFAGGPGAPRTAAMLATSMQSYVLGTTAQIARYISKGFFRPTGLAPSEVYAARKAAVQMLGVQLASAGVLGLPFVSGAIALLDKTFPDLEVNRHLREWMNEILGHDKENGNILTDAAMTGVPSMFGWDLQSRLSMGNTLPGVSEINGFQPEMLLGPPMNLITTFVSGGQKVTQGDVAGASDKFMPSALKKIWQLARNRGQVLDYKQRPIFEASPSDWVGTTLGFQPKRLSDYNAAQRIAKQADTNVSRGESQWRQGLAEQVLKGNFGSVQAELRKKMVEDPNFKPYEVIRSIAGAAEDLTFPRDLRRAGTGDVRTKLLATFNLPPTLPDETRRLEFRQQIERRLGLPVSTGNDQVLAQVMDQLRRQNPEASRSELRRQSELLLRGRRQQTLASPQE